MEEMSREHRVFDFFKYGALAVSPILNIYTGIANINIGFIVLMALMVFEILMSKGRFEINVELFIIFSIMIVLNIVAGFIHMRELSIELTMNNTYTIIIMAVMSTYYVRRDVLDRERFFKYLFVVGLVCSAFVFIQYVLYHLAGRVVYGFIPGLSVDPSIIENTADASVSYGRPTSLFSEPAHFAIFILPVYAIALDKRKFFLCAVFLLALILSTSSTGMMGAIIVTAIFIAREPKIPLILKWVLMLVGVVFFIQFLPTISESGIFEKVKFVNLKSNTRIFGTLEYFKYFGTKELLFGVGLNQLSAYILRVASRDVNNYASALFFVFFSFGVLGGSIWTWFVFRLHRLSKNKILFIVFLIVYLSDQILFNRNLFYLLLILYVFSDKNEEPAVVGGS
jgi:hypothetical protein